MLIRHLFRRSTSVVTQLLPKHLSAAPLVVAPICDPLYCLIAPLCSSFACSRGFAATALEEPVRENAPSATLTKDDARSILQNVKVQQFRQRLLQMSEEKISIPQQELLTQCQEHGAASTQEDAERICRALDSAGVVLRLANQVYLRPEDVAEQVIQAVPNTEAEIKAKLDHLKAEIEPLDKVKHHVDMRIHRRTKIVIWLALGAFLVQWAIFLRLTFWELSWDVMEPITYFTSSLFGICTYTYFMGTNREFGYKDATSHLRSRWEEREYRSLKLDPTRYQQLVKDIHRYQRYLAAKAGH